MNIHTYENKVPVHDLMAQHPKRINSNTNDLVYSKQLIPHLKDYSIPIITLKGFKHFFPDTIYLHIFCIIKPT